MMTILDGSTVSSPKKTSFANIDLKQLDVDLKLRSENSPMMERGCLVETEKFSDAQREENKPPKWTCSLERVSWDSSLPRLLDRILKTLTWLGNGLGKPKA